MQGCGAGAAAAAGAATRGLLAAGAVCILSSKLADARWLLCLLPCSHADVAVLCQLTSLAHLDLRRQQYSAEDAHPPDVVAELAAALPCCDIVWSPHHADSP